MPDVYLLHAPGDAEKAGVLAERLNALKVSCALLGDARMNAEGRAEALNAASVVLIGWTKTAVAHQVCERQATSAMRGRRLISVRLEPCTLPMSLMKWATIEGAGMLDDPEHPGWRALLKQVESRVGRPGIASFDLLMAGCDADAIGAWADSHPNDPLVPRALELETQIRADDLRIRVRAQTLPSSIAFGEDQKKPRRLFGVSPDTWRGAVWGGALLSVVGCGVYLFAQSVLQPAATPAAQALRSGPSADVRFVPAHAGENGLSEAEAELRNHPLVYAAVKAAGKKASISRSLAKEAEALADAVDNGLAVDAPVGMAELADGSTYRGQMVDGRPGGIGVRTDPPKEGGAIFAGDMAKGLGTTTWPDGVSFSGAHVGGKPGGLGALHYVDGGMFEGGVDAKGRQGVGVLRDGDGEIVQGGRWKNDKLVSDYRNTG